MNLLTDRECFKLIRKMEMMDHIIDHSVMVSNVALSLCRFLKAQRPAINAGLVRSSALLHDITKTRSFDTGERHSETGAQLLDKMGYPEIGDIIRQHVMLDKCLPHGPVSEPEIVNYADKRVLHDKVVSLDRRLAYVKVKYGSMPGFRDRVQQMWEETQALEIKLFRFLPFAPCELEKQITFEITRKAT